MGANGDRNPLEAPDRITIVSGLPRAGTSLTMQLLVAAGLEAASDDLRPADRANPLGYYELAAVRRIRDDAGFLADCRGRVVKIVAPLLFALPPVLPARVLFVERDLDEIMASQRAMLAGRPGGEAAIGGSPAAESDEAALRRGFAAVVARAHAWVAAANAPPTLFVSHRALLVDSRREVERMVDFLAQTGRGASDPSGRARRAAACAAMEAVVDPGLHRQRRPAGPGSAPEPGR